MLAYFGSEVVGMLIMNLTIEMTYVMVRGLLIALAQAAVTLSHLPRGAHELCFWIKYLPIKIALGVFGSLFVRKLVVELFLGRMLQCGMVYPLHPLFPQVYNQSVSILDCLNGLADEQACMTLHENATLMDALSRSIQEEKQHLTWHLYPWSGLPE